MRSTRQTWHAPDGRASDERPCRLAEATHLRTIRPVCKPCCPCGQARTCRSAALGLRQEALQAQQATWVNVELVPCAVGRGHDAVLWLDGEELRHAAL